MATLSKNYSDSSNGWNVTIYWECEYGDSSAYMWWEVNKNTYGRTFQIVQRYNTSNRYNSGSTLSVGTEYYLYVYSGGTYSQQKGPFKITTPDPPSDPDVISKVSVGSSSVQMKNNLLISIARDSGEYTHTLKYSFGGAANTIATGVGTSYAWTVPDLASRCNNATSGVCTITCQTYRNGSYVGDSSATVTLTVPNPTNPSVANSALTMGTAAAITCARNSTNFTIDMEYYFGNASGSIAEGKIDSCSWSAPYDLAKQIPNLTYGTGTIRCITKNGTAVVGQKDITVQLYVPENDITRPSFSISGLSLSPVSDLGEAFAGLYIRGKTGLKAVFTASSTYSTLSGYSISVGSVSAAGNPATIDALMNDGTVNVTAIVTDARGFSTSVSTTITVLPYRKPKVIPYTGYSNVICERAKETGELSPSGTYLAIKAGKSFSSVIVNGTEMNDCVLRYRWKISSNSDYGDWISLLAAGSAATEVSTLISNIVSSLSASYNVEISAVDNLGGEHVLSFQIMTEAISFVLYDGLDGAGFGKYPEAPHVVDIASHMTLLVRGKLVVTGSDWVGLGLSTGVFDPASGEYGRAEDCVYQVKDGNHIYVAFNCSYVYSGNWIAVNSVQIPEEYRPTRIVCAICRCSSGFQSVIVHPNGMIYVEDIIGYSGGETSVTWIDGYIDYWI